MDYMFLYKNIYTSKQKYINNIFFGKFTVRTRQ